jgi:hypothetical protein
VSKNMGPTKSDFGTSLIEGRHPRKMEAEVTAANSAIVDEYVTPRAAIGAASSSLADRHETDRALRGA